MADRAGIQVRGAARLRRTLKAAGDDLADLRQAHLAAATIAAAAARSQAPVGPTGRTAASVRPGATKTAAIIRAGRASMPWVGRVHYGDPGTGASKPTGLGAVWARVTGSGHGKISPHPYLTDGAQASEPVWGPAYFQALTKALNKIEGV